jgi:hypothetical protein
MNNMQDPHRPNCCHTKEYIHRWLILSSKKTSTTQKTAKERREHAFAQSIVRLSTDRQNSINIIIAEQQDAQKTPEPAAEVEVGATHLAAEEEVASMHNLIAPAEKQVGRLHQILLPRS